MQYGICPHFLLFASLAAFTATGCLPEEGILPSPDGQMLLCFSSTNTHLSWGNQRLESLGKGTDAACWLPDSSGIIAIHREEVGKWRDLEDLLPREQRLEVLKAMKALSCEDEGEIRLWASKAPVGLRAAVALLTRDDKAKSWIAAAINPPCPEVSVWQVQSYMVRGGRLQKDKVLARAIADVSREEYSDARVFRLTCSTAGKACAFTMGGWQRGRIIVRPVQMVVCNVSGPPSSRVVKSDVSAGFDWTPEGLSLVYSRPVSGCDPWREEIDSPTVSCIGVLESCQVCQDNGRLEEPTGESGFERVRTLASCAFEAGTNIKFAGRKSVLFSSRRVAVPSDPNGRYSWRGLYAVNSEGRPEVKEVVPPCNSRGTLTFATSGDGKYLSLVDPNMTLSVLERETGKKWFIKEAYCEYEWEVPLPVWRGHELIFVKKEDTKAKRRSLAAWSVGTGKITTLSDGWPKAAIQDICGGDAEAKERPATRPAESGDQE